MTFEIKLPDNLDLSQKDVLTALAAQLYHVGKLSLGQASDLAGLSKRELMESLSEYSVPVINHSADDLENDLKNASRYHS